MSEKECRVMSLMGQNRTCAVHSHMSALCQIGHSQNFGVGSLTEIASVL